MPKTEGVENRGQNRWSSRSVGAPWQHRFFYLLIRLGGRKAAYFFLFFVIGYYILFRPGQSAKGLFYLRRRFSETPPDRLSAHNWRLLLSLGRVLIDRAVVGILGPEAIAVTLSDKEELLSLAAEKKGLILMTAHVGCWQAAMSALTFLDLPVSLLMQREEGDIDRHFFEHGGGSSPYQIIDPRGFLGGSLEMLGVLKRGEVLSVMGDRLQGSDRNAVTVDFLGGQVRLPLAAYKLSSATGAPIAVLLSAKTGPDTYRIILSGVIRVPSGLGRKGEAYAPYAGRLVRILENYVQEYPYQFFNFFDLWEPAKVSLQDKE